MDFSLRSFAQAFEEAKSETRRKKFPIYAFILATPADRNVFPEILTHLKELHNLTGNDMLVIAPRITIFKAPDQPMNALEISEVLAEKKYFNYYGPSTVDVSESVNKFLNDQTNQTYRFAKFINLEMKEIPCLVFFDTLESPEKYIHWSLQGTSASDVIKDFREIMTVIQKAQRENHDMLNSINFIDKKRYVLKYLHRAVEVVPGWLDLFKP